MVVLSIFFGESIWKNYLKSEVYVQALLCMHICRQKRQFYDKAKYDFPDNLAEKMKSTYNDFCFNLTLKITYQKLKRHF